MLAQGQSEPTCTIPGGTNWVGANCGCGIVFREELNIGVYENKHNIKADTAAARVETYAVSPISPLGHTKGEFITITYANGYLASGCAQYTCTACNNTEGYYEEARSAIFASLGYSMSTYGESAMVQSYKVDKTAYNDFLAINSGFTFGVVAAGNAAEEEISPLKVENGVVTAINNKVQIGSFNKVVNDYFEIKISGITDETKNKTVVFCAYVFDGENLQYIEDGALVDSVVGVSYNDVAGAE